MFDLIIVSSTFTKDLNGFISSFFCCRLFLRSIHYIDAQVCIFLFITTEFKENIILQMICITCLFEFLDFVVLY